MMNPKLAAQYMATALVHAIFARSKCRLRYKEYDYFEAFLPFVISELGNSFKQCPRSDKNNIRLPDPHDLESSGVQQLYPLLFCTF